MKRHFRVLTMALVVMTLLLVGCSSTAPAQQTTSKGSAPASASASASASAPAKTYNWKLTSPFPVGMDLNRPLMEFSKTLEQRTNGAVKTTVYEGTLGAPADAWEMTKSNTVQLTLAPDAFNLSRMPIGGMVGLPFETTDPEIATLVLNEWLKAGYLKELTDNFKILTLEAYPPQSIFFRDKKVTKLEDLNGLKIRAASGVLNQALTKLGTTGISMATSEVYMGLDRGVIDGAVTGVVAVVDRKLYEVTKYGVRLPLSPGWSALVMNKETWNSLPPDLQKTIEQVSQEASTAHLKAGIQEEQSHWDNMAKKIEIYTLSKEEEARWRSAVSSVTDAYVQETAAKGHPAKEALELMRKTVAGYKKSN